MASYEYPDDGRAPGFGYTILAPVSEDGTFDSCWMDVWPQSDELKSLLWLTLTPGTDLVNDRPVLGRLNPRRAELFDAEAMYQNRVSAGGALAASTAGLALGYAAIRTRRLELSAALHAGVAKSTQLLQLILEYVIWGAVALVISSTAVLLLVHELTGPDRDPVLWAGLRIPLSMVCGGLIGTLGAALFVRERHLFRYFKTR